MAASSGWFGPPERPLFGWIHTPASGTARAGVVLCPSLGLEAGFSHSTLRQFAERLADAGFVALHFDYDGSGDSAGEIDDPDRLAAWHLSVKHAVDYLQTKCQSPIALCGMRIGALMATYEAERRGGIDALVLWDPPRGGRAYLRELRTRHSVSFGDDKQSESSVSYLGASFSNDTVTALGHLDLRSFRQLPAARCLVVRQPGRKALAASARTSTDAEVDMIDSPEQDDLLLRGVVPDKAVDAAVSWLDTVFKDAEFATVTTATPLASSASFVRGPSRVLEHTMALGPHNLFGIVSESDQPSNGPTVVFVPDAKTPHVGLSRIWVDLARSWASRGIRVVRFDMSGNGDSAVRPNERLNAVAAMVHFDDLLEAAEAISPEDPTNIVLVGTCSGAYQAMEAALERPVRGVCLINPSFAFITNEQPISRRRKAHQTTRRWLNRLFGRVVGNLARRLSPNLKLEADFEWHHWFEACYWQQAIARRTSKVPELVWLILNKGLLNRRPVDVLRQMVSRGTDVFLICGDPDFGSISLGARHALTKLAAKSNFTLVYRPEVDHSFLKSSQRDRVMQVLTEHVMARFLDPVPLPAIDQPWPLESDQLSESAVRSV